MNLSNLETLSLDVPLILGVGSLVLVVTMWGLTIRSVRRELKKPRTVEGRAQALSRVAAAIAVTSILVALPFRSLWLVLVFAGVMALWFPLFWIGHFRGLTAPKIQRLVGTSAAVVGGAVSVAMIVSISVSRLIDIIVPMIQTIVVCAAIAQLAQPRSEVGSSSSPCR